MIQMGTILEVADNSGARRIACIRMRGGAAGRYAHLGDVITASVKEAAWKLRLQKATGQLENPSRLRVIRRDIARVKTYQRALELAEKQ